MKVDFIGIIYASLMVIATATLGSKFTVIDEWYQKRKSNLTPPNYVFPIVWTILYFMIGISLYLAYVSEAPLIVHAAYAFNLVLNCAWSWLFFTMHKVLAACLEIVVLWASILVEIWLVFQYNPLAGKLLIPYLLWVTFAIVLSFQVLLNEIKIDKAQSGPNLLKEHKDSFHMPIDILGLVYASTAVVVTAAIGSSLTVIDEWYRKRKTILTPPDFVFPIAWTIIFVLIGYSLYLAYVSQAPLVVHLAYILNLVLNVLWSLIFFKFHRPFIALGEIALLWGSIFLAMDLVKPHNKLASNLLIPYLAWVSFAALLNFLVVLKDSKIKDKLRYKERLGI